MMKNAFRLMSANPLPGSLLLIVLLLPLIVSWGQFIESGFWQETISVTLLFWPKSAWKLAVPLPGWFIFAVFTLVYTLSMIRLAQKRSLVEAFLFILAGFLLAKAGGAAFQAISGWSKLQPIGSQELAGKANLLVFATWHNPLWEELVFRGIPLLLLALLYSRKEWPGYAKWLYLIVPSLLFACYHVPGHGLGTLFESFLIGVLWAFAALRWGLGAPIVLHIFADAMLVPTLPLMKNMPLHEIPWLVEYGWLFQSLSALCALLLAVSIPMLLFSGWRRAKRTQASEL
ncbi:CPBP family intramembrane metalloprotease [Brevibacillus sp. 1238]|uniref:CPBP family intramembrane glutamic endopeptidase n=1 Tax=Brevibacillus sp. 1238 TaxID=2940565 RepID=UPI002474ADC6|nr:CPBP family intramembrane metalloprotease [Brevibacillus sp. 1238]MDH6351021.1 hypothetical protein [Brevibacillus sp. 1238]